MSQENVEIVRAVFDAWNAGDMDAVAAQHDPNVIWPPFEGWPEAETLVGREAIMREWEHIREAWNADVVNRSATSSMPATELP